MADDLPSQVVEQLVFLVSRPDLPLSIGTTFLHAVIGLSLALAVVIPIIFLAFLWSIDETIRTLSVVFNTVPALAWVLLLLAAFGVFSPLPIVLTVSLTLLPIMLPIATSSLKVFIGRLLELGRLVHAPRSRSFRLIVLPAHVPLIISYVRAGLGFSVKMAMVAETFTASAGFGSRMMLAYSQGQTPQLLALSLLAIALAVGVDLTGKWVLGWRQGWS